MPDRVVVCGLIAVLACGLSLGAGGSRQTTPAAPPQTPDQQAVEHYNTGIDHRDRAASYEKKAAEAKPEKADKLVRKADTEYRRAAEQFRAAVEKNPRMHEAFSELGYVLRRSGSYADSLQAYDRALTLAPDYTPAIEYRGQAYLGLDRVEDAKLAYEALSRADRERALLLAEAMRRWIDHRRLDPGEIDSGTIEALESWLEAREGLTTGHAGVSSGDARGW